MAKGSKWSIPSPFTIAIGLTGFAFLLALVFTGEGLGIGQKFFTVGRYWTEGIWSLMEFTMQMALILLLGYTLALAPVVHRLTGTMANLANNNQQAVLLVAAMSMLGAWLNWGLGLVIGAIMAKKMAEQAQRRAFAINYPLVGAAGYSGMMLWHAGLSGSAPLTVAQEGHFLQSEIGLIPITETLFSGINLAGSLSIFLISLLFFGFLGSRPFRKQALPTPTSLSPPASIKAQKGSLGLVLGASVLLFILWQMFTYSGNPLNIFSLNFVNLMLFSLALIAHRSTDSFLKTVEQSVGVSAGILIQFPLYAGIMGIMKDSGLVVLFSDWISTIATADSLALLTFLSAGITNLLVPSGGGQWALQGPVLMEAAQHLGASKVSIVMAVAYGDQVTNMLQPFWALPLLAITQLEAKHIFKYSAMLMLLGMVIYACLILLF